MALKYRIMNYKFLFFTISLLYFLHLNISADNRIVNFLLSNGCAYDSLMIDFKMNGNVHTTKSEYVGNGCYRFTIPDSLFLTYDQSSVYGYVNGDSLKPSLGFSTIVSDKSLYMDLPMARAHSNKSDSTVFSGASLYWADKDTINMELAFAGRSKADYQNKTFITDAYVVTSDMETTLSIYSPCARYSYFRNFDRVDYSYDYYLDQYMSLSKKYPDSRTLMTTFSFTLCFYQQLSDIERMFACFSEKNKQSHHGKQVADYIRLMKSSFKNMELDNSITGMPEKIILDSDRPVLVVFSASWCAPCHDLIPLLRSIYEKVNSKMDIVYITIDEPKTINQWKRMLDSEKIPWRSFSPGNRLAEVKLNYKVGPIPLQYLVYPNGNMEKLEIRREADLQKVFDLYNKL